MWGWGKTWDRKFIRKRKHGNTKNKTRITYTALAQKNIPLVTTTTTRHPGVKFIARKKKNIKALWIDWPHEKKKKRKKTSCTLWRCKCCVVEHSATAKQNFLLELKTVTSALKWKSASSSNAGEKGFSWWTEPTWGWSFHRLLLRSVSQSPCTGKGGMKNRFAGRLKSRYAAITKFANNIFVWGTILWCCHDQ